jgi:hypothetical protein
MVSLLVVEYYIGIKNNDVGEKGRRDVQTVM